MNRIRPILCLAILALAPAAMAIDLCPLQVPSLPPSLPSIPSAPSIQPMPQAAPVYAAPAPAIARPVQNGADGDGAPCFFHSPEYVPTSGVGDDDGCIPRPIKPIRRPPIDPTNGDVVDLRGLDTNKPVKILR